MRKTKTLEKLRKETQESLIAEGWQIITGYGKGNIILSNEKFFGDFICRMSAYTLNTGSRPVYTSIINKLDYVNSLLENEGWEFVDGDINKVMAPILIKHKSIFNSRLCRIRLQAWLKGARPNTSHLLYPEDYIKEEMQKEGWYLESKYENVSDCLYVR
jgi:hypothetical protein